MAVEAQMLNYIALGTLTLVNNDSALTYFLNKIRNTFFMLPTLEKKVKTIT